MKILIEHLTPHQNAKVIAIVMAVSSTLVLIPMSLFMFAFTPQQARPAFVMVMLMPLFYLVTGYIMVALVCVLYNFIFRYTGGVEFYAADGDE